MSNPDQNRSVEQRMDALSSALARLLRRQNELDSRLARIEAAVGVSPPAKALPLTVEPPPVPASPIADIPPSADLRPSQPSETQPPEIEAAMGLTWLNRIGAFTLLLAAAFAFKLAIDNQWVTEGIRVALGVLLGLTGIGAAEWLYRRGHSTYSQGICAVGIGVLFLSFYASFSLYRMVAQPVAFGLMTLTTAAAVALSLRYGSAALAFLALLGGYATPVVLTTGVDQPWAFFGYVALLNVAAVGLHRMRGWVSLPLLAVSATVVLGLLWGSEHLRQDKRIVATVFTLLYYAMFAATPLAPVWLAAQFLAPLFWAAIWAHSLSAAAAGTVAITAAGLVIATKRSSTYAPVLILVAFWMAHLWWPESPKWEVLFWGTIGFVLIFAWMPWRAAQGLRATPIEHAAAILNPVMTLASAIVLLYGQHRYALGIYAIAIGAMHLGIAAPLMRWSERTGALVSYVAGHVLTILGLSLLIDAWVSGRGTGVQSLKLLQAALSITWAAYAVALIAAGIAGRQPVNRILGLLLMGLVVGKLYFYDVWNLDTVYRVAAFTVLGVFLLLSSFLYSKLRGALQVLLRGERKAS